MTLSVAAKEPVKATSMDVDEQKLSYNPESELNVVSYDKSESVNESFESKLETVNQVVNALSKSFDASIEEVNKNQDDIKNLLVKQNSLMEKHNTYIRMQWAHGHCEMGSFQFKECNDYHNHNPMNSTKLAREAIGWFMIGKGMLISRKFVMVDFDSYARKKEGVSETGRSEFRHNFKGHLRKLIGKEPRVEKISNESFSIWYE